MNVRYAFLDVYRGFIVLCMIEGHVVRALLYPSLQDSGLFRLHELFHGIVGPGFLFGAGITFGISVQRHWDDFLSLTPRLLRRGKKILLLFALGYALHLPFFSLSKTLHEATASDLAVLFSFDVLQCIALSLLLLHLLMLVVRRERFFVISTIIMMTMIVYAAPIVWRTGTLNHLPLFLSSALRGNGGSLYPLVPYGGFLFAGALASYEFMRLVEQRREAVVVRRLALAGSTLFLFGLIADAIPVQTYEPYSFWLVSPNFFLMRLGCLLLLLSGIWFLEHTAFERRLSEKHGWLVLFGVESLFVYVVHLVVLYGCVLNPEASFSFRWAGNLNWSWSLLIAFALIVLLYGLARIWNFLKVDHPILFRGLVWWLTGIFLLEFFIRSY